jgi:hypothetical protein
LIDRQRVVFGIIVTLALSVAVAQEAPGDRLNGEEEQILRRIEWFVQSRGLDRIHRADLRRRQAVLQAKTMSEADLPRGLQPWRLMGPESMTMLDWVMGPVAGRVSALAVHPTDEDVIYLGAASGGLWKTINGGSSWVSLFDDVGTQTIGAITIDPASPETVWVGTGEQGQSCWSYFGMGLFRSTDGGATFEEVNGSGNSALDLSYISAIVLLPGDPQVILASGESFCNDGNWLYGGLFRSTDGGAAWTKVLAGAITDMVVSPGEPNVIFAAVGRWSHIDNGVYQSTDRGVTWNRITSGPPSGSDMGRSRLAVAPGDGRILYALMNESGGVGLYRSTDRGMNWTRRNSDACDGQCWYNLCLAVHPTDASTLLTGTVKFFSSTNGGTSLTPLIDGWGENQKVHQDTHVLVYSKTDGSRFWVGGDGGLWRTDDGGSSFVNLNANLNITQFYDIEVHPIDSATLYGGAQDNSSLASFADPRWNTTLVTGDGFMNVVDPADPNTVIQSSYPYDGYPNLFVSVVGGGPGSFSWLPVDGLIQFEPWPWVTPLVAADAGPLIATSLFVASNHVYRSGFDSLGTWTKISGNLTGSSSSGLSVLTPVVDDGAIVLYAGASDGQIWRTDDALATSPTWVEVTGDYPGGRVTDIAADPSDPQRVFLTRGEFGANRLYRSTSGGGVWQAVGGGLPDAPANTVAIDPRSTQRVFVGTDVGVFVSSDGGESFVAAMDGLPLGAVVTDLEIDDEPYVLTAGTYGRGAWQTDLTEFPLFADGFESGDTSAWTMIVE